MRIQFNSIHRYMKSTRATSNLDANCVRIEWLISVECIWSFTQCTKSLTFYICIISSSMLNALQTIAICETNRSWLFYYFIDYVVHLFVRCSLLFGSTWRNQMGILIWNNCNSFEPNYRTQNIDVCMYCKLYLKSIRWERCELFGVGIAPIVDTWKVFCLVFVHFIDILANEKFTYSFIPSYIVCVYVFFLLCLMLFEWHEETLPILQCHPCDAIVNVDVKHLIYALFSSIQIP